MFVVDSIAQQMRMKFTRFMLCGTVHSLVYLWTARQRGLAYAPAVNLVSRYKCSKTVASLKSATSSTPASILRQKIPRTSMDL